MKRVRPDVQTAIPGLARLLAGLLLGLALLAGRSDLHHSLHDDGDGDHTGCAICLLANGQVAGVDPRLPSAPQPTSVALSPPAHVELPPKGASWRIAPTRGPPVLSPLPSDS